MRNKRDRFIALAEARTEKALQSVRLLENLSNRSNYEYEPDELDQILRAVEHQVRQLRLAYSKANQGADSGFKLKVSRQSQQRP